MTDHRVALVTGGGSGMGKATSMRLAREGRAVGVLDIDEAAAKAVASEITAAGGKAIAVAADISDRGQVKAALGKVRAELGPVTILINNAAIENFCPLGELDDETWDRLMAVNLKGFYIVTQEVLPDMEAAGWGRVVNLSAIGAQTGAPDMALYTASKGGVIAMTRSLAVELGRKGITVNSVSPGFIDTPMARRAIDGDLFPVPYEQILQGYPIPRLGLPEEIAAACCFFASEDAGYVTGQLLGVNGGAAV
ncbi:SDR family NAD(P)-dependent oxidoreductase [Novosphingobium album (ex Hu et al. 2023)]|uniref:SDR family oxidoreductase n=1 Tax=Novosphingobium album (ex Hu et al. 2023) TaxID=2930093 RepID=A0ABT0B708_9SPHN|nr:SDR family NAD(P)-dependent oxidoreductase [Novosphingobium album (ex Hu et al. 2023)]MCJ2180850.1 SDR family oxidoreductase [Novosphingobium album (ex Hu et al. 2023)]